MANNEKLLHSLLVAREELEARLSAIAASAVTDDELSRGMSVAGAIGDIGTMLDRLQAGQEVVARPEPSAEDEAAFHEHVSQTIQLRGHGGERFDDQTIVAALGGVAAEFRLPDRAWRCLVAVAAELELRRLAAEWASAAAGADDDRQPILH